MGNCSTCDVDCFYCIERKETKFDIINQINNPINQKKEINFNQIQQSEFTLISTTKRLKNDEITSLHTIDDNTLRKKINEIHDKNLNECNHRKNISLQMPKFKLESHNNTQNPINQENHEIEINNILNIDTNRKYFEEMNKEGNEDEKKSDLTLRYNHTNFKSTTNVSFLKYFEKLEDNSKNFDMTENHREERKRYTQTFPIKFNYEKDKYINYFADDSI